MAHLTHNNIFSPLPFKELNQQCKDYELRVLFFDPKEIYQRIQINHYHRFPSLSMRMLFPKNGKICGCGCDRQLEGKKTRWASEECSNFAVDVYRIMAGDVMTISYYLKKYIGEKVCLQCGVMEYFRTSKVGNLICGIELDHVLPVHKGGGGCWLTNYQFLCYECHKPKTKKDISFNEQITDINQQSLELEL